MSSDKFVELAKKIAERDKPTFDTLMDYEKTGKIRSKTRLNFTIDKTVANNFKKYCRDKGYNMSKKVEQALKQISNN